METSTTSCFLAIFIIVYSSLHPGLNAASIPENHNVLGGLEPGENDNVTNEGELPTTEPNRLGQNGKFKLNISAEFEFLRKQIEKNRIITIDIDGNERVSTDEEVMKTLEYVYKDKSTFLFNEPHFEIDEGLVKRHIIGADNRYRGTHSRAPYSAIGYLSTGCTAYLVGPRHLITAAHCVHHGSNTGAILPPSQLTFYLRRNCYTSGVRYGISQVLTYSQYRNNGDADYDIACLLLSSTVSSWMGFAYHDPMPRVSGEICGYPHDKFRTYECFYCSSCSDVERAGWWIFRSNTRLQYTCDTEGGMSGSPVMTGDHDSSTHLYSYGVHTQGRVSENQGVRISRNYFYDICRWMCDTGATCTAVCP